MKFSPEAPPTARVFVVTRPTTIIVITLALLAGLAAGARGQCPGGQCPTSGPSPYYRSSTPPQVAQPGDTTPVPRSVTSAVARVQNWVGPQQRFEGAGTLVAKGQGRGLVVTCAHTFYDRDKTAGRAVVVLGSGSYGANILGHDAALDVLLLEIREPPETPLELADEAPVRGAPVVSLGYDQALAASPGQVLEYLTRLDEHGRPGPAGANFSVSGRANHGFSGGPILDAQWKVCAVLYGTGGGKIDGVALPRLRAFLDRWRSRAQFRRQQAPILNRQPRGQGSQGPGARDQVSDSDPRPLTPDPRPLIPPKTPDPQLQSELDRTRAELAQARIEANEARTAAQQNGGSRGQGPGIRTGNLAPDPQPLDFNAGRGERMASEALKSLNRKLFAAVGLSGAGGAIAAAAVTWFVMRRAKQRAAGLRQRIAEKRAPPERVRQVVREVPPLEPVRDEYHYTQTVEVPDNTKDRCWAQACQVMMRNYPGTQKTIKALQNVKNQLLKGEPVNTGDEG